jgi:hypothetical protein
MLLPPLTIAHIRTSTKKIQRNNSSAINNSQEASQQDARIPPLTDKQ